MKKIALIISTLGLLIACSEPNTYGNSGPIPGNSDKKDYGEMTAHTENTNHETTKNLSLDAEGNAKYDLGTITSLKLNDSLLIKAPADGPEVIFLSEIKKGVATNPAEGWINLKGVQFKKGTTQYANTVAQEEVNNIAAILKANPTIKIKIGGYSSTEGDNQVNLKLSQERANKILTDLSAKGLAKQLDKAEGYGEAHTICDENSAKPEELDLCNAQNRRVSIKITEILK